MRHQRNEIDAELNNKVVGTEPCPKCGSPDNVKRYSDGHAHCFTGGCGYHEGPRAGYDKGSSGSAILSKRREAAGITAKRGGFQPGPGAFDAIDKRRISGDTLRFYGAFVHFEEGSKVFVFPQYNQKGEMEYQKLRLPGKEFTWKHLGDDAGTKTPPKKLKLMGQEQYGERYNGKVVVTVGEFDAMSVHDHCKPFVPAVSVTVGDDGAVDQIKANYQWLDRFKEIILWFDDDESGRKTANEVARLFKVGKVKIARADGFKDASDVSQANLPGTITEAVYSASTWKPLGIVNAADNVEDVLGDDVGSRGYDWPWGCLNETTMGIQPGQAIYIISGTGIGKTTLLYEVVYKLWQQGAKIGIMCFEDMRRDVKLGLMTAHRSVRYQIEQRPEEERRAVHEELFGSRRFELFDPETAQWDMEAILGYVRFMRAALDCDVVVIDPLSFILAGTAARDKLAFMDKVAMEIAQLTKEMGFPIIVSHHLRKQSSGQESFEEGAQVSIDDMRGSGNLSHFASLIIALERNQQAEADDDEPDTVAKVRILKNRRGGKTGQIGRLEYDPKSGRYKEVLASVSDLREAVRRKAVVKDAEQEDKDDGY